MPHEFKIDFIGIGAQKAATSWLYKCLLEHPRICGFSGKETHFFSDEKKFIQGIDYYRGLFSNCGNGKITGEFSVSYLSCPEAVQRIKEYFPEVKLLVILRHPLERAYSHILHLRSKKYITAQTPLKTIIEKYPGVIENGLYGKHLTRYLNEFSREKILILFYEDIKTNPAESIKRAYKFIGADTDFIPRGTIKKYHTSAARMSPAYLKVNRLYTKLSQNIIGRSIIKTMKLFGINAYLVNDLFNKFSKPKRAIFSHDRQYLLKFFLNDINKLGKLLDKDLSVWKK